MSRLHLVNDDLGELCPDLGPATRALVALACYGLGALIVAAGVGVSLARRARTRP